MPARSPMPLIVPCTQRRARAHGGDRGARSRGRSRCGRGSGPARPARATRACGRRGRRPPRAWRSRSCRRRPTSFAPASTALLYTCSKKPRSARVAVDAEEGDVDPVLGGEARSRRDPLEHRLARDAERLELQVGDRRLDHASRSTPSSTSASTSAGTAREKPQTSASQARVRDQLGPRPSRPARRAGSRPRSGRSRARRAARAISSFCSGSSTTPTVCSPSRRVVS